MDTDGKDVTGELSGVVTATVSVNPDKQEVDVNIMEDSANAVHSFKESVEILSVEVVQSPLDVQHNKDQLEVKCVVNDEVHIETQQPAKEIEGSCFNEDESDNNNAACINNTVDHEGESDNTAGAEYDALPKVNSGPFNSTSASVDTFQDSLAIDAENNNSQGSDGPVEIQESRVCQDKNTITSREPNEGTSDNAMTQENITISDQFPVEMCQSVESPNTSDFPNSRDCQKNISLTGRVLSEDTSDNAIIQETITISDMQQFTEDVCQLVKDPNEMEDVVEFSGKSLTSADILPFSDMHNESVNTTLTPDENVEPNTTMNSITGLSLLAQYGSDNEASDSDSDSVVEVPTSNHDYRNRIVEIDSDSDSSSSSSDLEYLNKIRKTIEKRMELDDDDDEDDGDAEHGNAQTGIRKKLKPKVKAKGELNLDDLPPIQDLQITVAEDECIVLGKIHSIVDQLVLVSALPDSMLVDLETVFFLDKGQRVLGAVFDVLGQVADPLYCVRFNSNQQINDKNIQINDVVYMAPKTQYTQYIILSSIMKQKGSDASWENDLEPPPRFVDYSDDEQQSLARRQLRNKDRPVDQDDPQKRARMDPEQPQVPSCSRPYISQPRQRYPYPTRGNGGPPNRGSYGRSHQQYNPQHRNPQMPPTHNPSSWHSNYYPQPYAGMPSPNVPYVGGYPRMPQQAYPQVPVYPMGMPYPPPPHARPPNNHPEEHHRFMPNAFNMRLPTIPRHYDPTTPPPGSE